MKWDGPMAFQGPGAGHGAPVAAERVNRRRLLALEKLLTTHHVVHQANRDSRSAGGRQDQATRRLGEHRAKQPADPKTGQGRRIGGPPVCSGPILRIHAAAGLVEAGNPKAIGVGWKRIDLCSNGMLGSGWLGFAGVLEASAALNIRTFVFVCIFFLIHPHDRLASVLNL
ncbi:hypothetical protein CMUS01_12980 [Colletotrichum musicola]|uniref:Uncharacterized protein n=1 Tax=Colletotrichum musicola TaxID=2175873 RepID=A0A8H6JHR5_9PEZI|nr:hypothetical protein CMUS01_12980 [Colletotrichum musicola]